MANQRDPEKRIMTFWVDAKTKKQFEALCAKKGVSASARIIDLIEKDVSPTRRTARKK